ncbi:class I SAM-dependent methyltransferase, partial [Campylobacter fetus]|nr:class I SAM-dependent methyltransferase [Campylobacter fetus]
MENEFTQFYKEHNISPVSQDLSDINLHLKRRANLYQMLGIDKRLFKNRDVLEVGPGSGFNSICFCKWGANLDLVEPNDKGRKEISQNLNGYKFRLYDDFIENFVSSKKYDFVIAEGFLPSLNNSKDILSSLIKLVKKDGILVTTCIDEFSHFYEDLRRITGFILIRNLEYFDERVKILCKAFKSHLSSLKFASRPIEDWVSDVVLNPVNDNKFLSIKNYIKIIDKITNGGGYGANCGKSLSGFEF